MTQHEKHREFATEIVGRLRHEGFQAYWAGGCVRDVLLGLEPADYDVATDATPEQVMAIFGRRTIPVGVSFGVVRVRDSRGGGEVEVATFRSDGAYVDGRHPESVVFSSPEQDAERRDFTINGMFSDPFSGEVIDYVGGRADLDARILRAIGDPWARFREDKLRLLRAIRFASRFRLTIDPATESALVTMASQIHVVAAERIAQEFRRMLVHDSRARAMNRLLETGLAAHILPPLLPMKGVFQGKPVQPEGDLWDHVLLVLDLLPPAPSFPLAFATLLHDVGKPRTMATYKGRISFHNHELVGRKIADDLCRRLKLSNTEREQVCWLVEFHQYLGDATRLREAKLKRMLSMPGIDDLLALHRADALASIGESPQVDYCRYYIEAQPSGPINPAPLVTGHDLVRHGLTPGSHFSTILEQIREAQLDRVINSKREALDWLDEHLESLRAEKP
ncbi:poly(A) polymerase [Singulisphaera sp. GP187]|uniref:CCA tRNA nucleotidyltransferase n=1 Tax=Singulisphaera sp. GP187 TaxID=1882752 RepID=UPI0009259794|nr:CCA tRNA nucleotidyltransferase [Singulisphaera sp. GP187]SIN98389.1 poly(A) polymerase [Singulisphaera sp. GP187]